MRKTELVFSCRDKLVKNSILKIVDSAYFIFKKWLPLKTYRYAVCGGGNLILDTLLYFVCFQFMIDKQNIDLQFIVLSPHIAALFIVFPVTFCTGFLLNRFVVFSESKISIVNQFLRYLAVGVGALILSYLCMKFLVDFLQIYPTPSRLITIVITVLFSYIMQNKFSFKV